MVRTPSSVALGGSHHTDEAYAGICRQCKSCACCAGSHRCSQPVRVHPGTCAGGVGGLGGSSCRQARWHQHGGMAATLHSDCLLCCGCATCLSLRAGVIPFIIGAYEFGKRILIQRQCQVCEGSGLVQRGRYLRKCPEASAHAPCTLHAGKPAALCPTCKDRQLSHYSLSAVWWILSMAGLGQVLHIYCSPWQWGAFEGPERADISLL